MSEIVVSSVGDLRLNKALREPLSNALEILQQSDVAFGNLEAPFTDHGEPADKWAALKQNPKLVSEYTKTGFKILQLANNHMLDYGREGLTSTLRTLREASIKHVGAGENIDEALRRIIIEQRKLRIAFLGCASTLPGESVAGKNRSGIAPLRVRTTYHFDPEMEKEQPGNPPVIFTEPNEDDVGTIAAEIGKARAEADYVIVGVHWGMAYQENVMDYQSSVGRSFIDAGANLVIGHHPHRLQAVHRYKDGFIFYSLGNFFFDTPEGVSYSKNTKWRHWPPRLGMWSQSHESMIVRTRINSSGEASHELTPTTRMRGGMPQILKEPEGDRLLRHLESLSEGGDVKFSIKNGKATLG